MNYVNKKGGLLALFGRKQAANDHGESQEDGLNVLERDIGAVCQEQDLALHFEVDPEWKGNVSKLKHVPFQLQAFFQAQEDGARKVRVYSAMLDASPDRTTCEKSLIASVVALGAVQRSATLANQGHHEEALEHFASAMALVERAAKSDEQQEESYIMKEETKTLLTAISSTKTKKDAGDDMVAAIAAMRKAPLRQFQSAARKDVQKRRVAADQQEHVQRFGVEAAFEN